MEDKALTLTLIDAQNMVARELRRELTPRERLIIVDYVSARVTEAFYDAVKEIVNEATEVA